LALHELHTTLPQSLQWCRRLYPPIPIACSPNVLLHLMHAEVFPSGTHSGSTKCSTASRSDSAGIACRALRRCFVDYRVRCELISLQMRGGTHLAARESRIASDVQRTAQPRRLGSPNRRHPPIPRRLVRYTPSAFLFPPITKKPSPTYQQHTQNSHRDSRSQTSLLPPSPAKRVRQPGYPTNPRGL